MKSSEKKWIIIAIILIIIGSLIFVGALAALDFDFSRLNTQKYTTNTYEVNDRFENISVNTDTADITFALSDNNECKVVSNETDKVKHSVTVQDDTLIIDTVDTRKWYDNIGIFFDNIELVVYLPEAEYSLLTVETDTGDVTMPEDITFENASIQSDTGDIKWYALVSGKLEIETDTGDIELIDVNCLNFNGESNTGDISLDSVIAGEGIYIESDTGDVSFDKSDAETIFVETNTGDVCGTLLSEKVFITESSTGEISVPRSADGGMCEISTDTGDIDVTIVK